MKRANTRDHLFIGETLLQRATFAYQAFPLLTFPLVAFSPLNGLGLKSHTPVPFLS